MPSSRERREERYKLTGADARTRMDHSPLRLSASSSLRASNVFASSEGVTVMVPSKMQQPWGRSAPGSARKNASSRDAGKKRAATGKPALPSSSASRGDAPTAIITELRNANAVLGTELHRSHLVKDKEKVGQRTTPTRGSRVIVVFRLG